MAEVHPLRCSCGTLTGTLAEPDWLNRVVCYRDSCQAFAAYLGRASEILDDRGGSDILQTSPRHLTITGGRELLACVRVTPKGPLRWYAACCRTPIGNTPANYGLSFVGLLHNCLGERHRLDAKFGPPAMRVFTASALGEPKPATRRPAAAIARMAGKLARARLNGSYRQTPFFDGSGRPLATPTLAGGTAPGGQS